MPVAMLNSGVIRRVELPSVVSGGGGDEFACVVKEVGMDFEEDGQFFVEVLFRHNRDITSI